MSVYIHEGAFWESDKVKRIFSIENSILNMCKIEGAIANAEADMGIISRRDAQVINAKADLENIDMELYNDLLIKTGGHPIVPFLESWRKSFGDDPAKNAIHYGAASPDVFDNVKILQLREVHKIIQKELFELREVLRRLADQHRDSVMVGRTHHQHAVPITFGQKMATWLMEVNRQILRLNESAERVFMGSCYGAAGCNNTFGEQGPQFNRLVAKYLDLTYCPVSWQTSRDTELEYICDLVNITNTAGKFALELYELSRTEVMEIEEAWAFGNIGSSTMPQKRNPWGLEIMIAIARTCTSQIVNEFNCMAQFHERDFMVQYQEDFSMPVICQMTEHILQYGIKILDTMKVYPEQMKKNLEMTNGLNMLEHVMMVLTKKMNRYDAHEKLYEYAMESHKSGVHIKELLLRDKEIMEIISEAELNEAFDYHNYIGSSNQQIDAALEICK